MKIPKYESQGSVSAPQLRTSQLPAPIKLDSIIGEIENAYDGWEKEQARAYKVYKLSEQQNTQIAIDQKYAEIKDRIDNGGSYADAEKEFKSFYDKTVSKSLGKFNNDPLSAQEISLDYRKAGAEYGMRLKNDVRSRARSDAKDSWGIGLDSYKLKLLNSKTITEAQSIMKDVATHYANGESAGIIKKGSGSVQIPLLLDDTINSLIEQDPFTYMSMYENNRDALAGVTKPGLKYKAAKIKAAQIRTLADAEFTLKRIAEDRDQASRFYNMEPTVDDMTGDNPFTRLQKKKDLASAMPDTERDEKIRDFRSEVSGLKQLMYDFNKKPPESMSTEEGYAAGLARIEDTRKRINEAVEQGVFVGGTRTRSHASLLSDLDEVLQRYSAPLKREGVPFFSMQMGSPAHQFKKTVPDAIEKQIGSLGLGGEKTFIAMTQMRDAVFAREEEVSSLRTRKEQAAKLQEIMADEFMNIVNDQYPHLAATPQAQEAKRILTNDGSDIGKPQAKVNRPSEPKVGDIVDGYMYKGGPMGDPNNWEKQ